MFLATTALEDFWDRKDDIVLLGEWCKTENTENLNSMCYIWNHKNKIANAIKKCEATYEFFLDVLTSELNSFHKIDKSTHYYRILLGEWLYHYININYDRFITIYLFYKEYGKFNTILLDNKEFYKPFDFKDFISVVQRDEYNLQLYSQIITFLFKNNKFKSKSLKEPISKHPHEKIFFKESIKMMLLRKTSLFLSFFSKDKILICEPYFGDYSFKYSFKLLIKSRFKIVFDNMIYVNKMEVSSNYTVKKEISIESNNLFKKYIASHILNDLPSIYLENYQLFRYLTLQKINYIPKIFYTATSLYGNNEAKIFLAEYYKEINIISHQHGGLYGWLSDLWGEKYERDIADYFLTSGWKEDNTTIPFGLPMLLKDNVNDNNDNNITYITTNASKYLLRFVYYPASSIYLKEFFMDMKVFFSNLDGNIINDNFVIRPYHTITSFNMINKIIQSNNYNMKVDTENKMSNVINNSKLLIFDHMGTTILETLFLNKPTVIFIDFNIYKFRDSFLDIIQELLDCKILHDSPLSASKHINNIYDNVDGWWHSDNVQQTRKKFVNKYAKNDKNWDTKLISLFQKIIDTY